MHEHTEQFFSSHRGGMLTEVELRQAYSDRVFSPLRRRWRQWWTEERLALLAIGLGNTCLFAVVLWWLL